MNILIPNSWLREFLRTNTTPKQFSEAMSLTSVSVERMQKIEDDIVFDIEVTTNRPDLMSIEGIAREASAVLPQAGYKAQFKQQKLPLLKSVGKSPLLTIVNDASLVNRIVAVVMEVNLKPSPPVISKRLEKTGIRSINNIVDVTNYIMREVGHPAHVFDYDRLLDHKIIIRKSKRGESITTLDEKNYQLPGNDIVADNGTGEIIDLLGIMGTANSVVTKDTKRVVLFLDNNNAHLLRKTSMNLGIRTEAAILNEKGVDPELMLPALSKGIELYKEIANGKLLSDIIDIYPNRPNDTTVTVTNEKISKVIGIEIPEETTVTILKHLGFGVFKAKEGLVITIPSTRLNDIQIPEDIIEEVARVYGYHKIPNVLPPTKELPFYHQSADEFYWISKIKNSLLFRGFNEVYTYSTVSEELFDGPIETAVRLKNPLTEDRIYLRNALIPSILEAASFNKTRENLRLFEISNVYTKRGDGLPDEYLHLGIVVRENGYLFYDAKGIVEDILTNLGIKKYTFTKKDEGIEGAIIVVDGKNIGMIEVEEETTIEINLHELLKFATDKKAYKKIAKFPPMIEDVRLEIAPHYLFQEISGDIKKLSELIDDVTLLDVYKDKKTFRITYLDRTKNLANDDVLPIREKIYKMLEEKFKAKIG